MTTLESIRTEIITFLTDPATWTGLLLLVAKVAVIYIGGKLLLKFANRAIEHVMAGRERSPLKMDSRRSQTIAKLVRNVITYVVNFIVILMILGQFGVSLGPVLAGAGVVGLAVGFGAQSLVKDVITGFFIIFEDQFSVGDIIQVNGYKGTVEEIGLRVTRLRSWTGEVHIIPNGMITDVTNFSIYNSIAVVDVSVAYEADIEQAMKVLEAAVMEHYAADEDMVKEPQLLGVQMLGASEIVLRVTGECKPNTHFAVGRKLNAKIKKAFDEAGIAIAYPRVVTYHRTEKAEA